MSEAPAPLALPPLSILSPKLLDGEPLNWNPECLDISKQLCSHWPGSDPQPAGVGFLPGFNHSTFAHFGQREEPWFTGAGTDGFRFAHLWKQGFPERMVQELILANYSLRPDKYDPSYTGFRKGGYGDGWRAQSSTLGGQQAWNGVFVYGHDYEHVIVQHLVELASLDESRGVPISLTMGNGVIVTVNAVTLARELCKFVRASVCGQMRAPWSVSNRPTERVSGRLLYAMLKLLPITGLDGADETAFWNFLDLTLDCYVASGPWHMPAPDFRGLGCVPPVTAPYWCPTHSLVYYGATLYWILQTGDPKLATNNRQGKIEQLLAQMMPQLIGLIGPNGEMPWLANDTVAGYQASNGIAEPFAPSAEVMAGVCIAERLGVPGATQKREAIQRWFDQADTFTKNAFQAWMVDATCEPL